MEVGRSGNQNKPMSEVSLRAGPLVMLYQDGFLRYIAHGENEILRMIYFALRDENWGTYSGIITNEKLDIQEDHFTIHYDCLHERAGKPVYHWKATIVGNKTGQITFELIGTALENVLKNRAGFCILHPIQGVAGEPCETLHPDGRRQSDIFPKFVSPTNPFRNLKGMRWKSHNLGYSLQFDGELFETEDQRNWTDASFKTFCTPLEKPFPVQVTKGGTVFQKISFSPEQSLTYHNHSNPFISITQTGKKFPLPAIGICASTETDLLHKTAIEAIRRLSLSHYRIEVAPYEENWMSRFKIDCENAKKLHLPVECALTVSSDLSNELNQFIVAADHSSVRLNKIILLSKDSLTTDQHLIRYASDIKRKWTDVAVGGGTDYNFTELNRNRFDAEALDFISFSIHPQEHAFDDRTLIENMEGQREVAESAHQLYPEKSIQVSPLTLRRRFNPYATDPMARVHNNEERTDPRQMTQFGSLFLLGSIKALAEGKVEAITLFQTVGNQGILSIDGNPYPVYDLLQELLDKPYRVLGTQSSNPLKGDALLLEWEHIKKLIMVNYTRENQSLLIDHRVYELMPFAISIQTILTD
jgi:hypothetical protein